MTSPPGKVTLYRLYSLKNRVINSLVRPDLVVSLMHVIFHLRWNHERHFIEAASTLKFEAYL